jgi:murein DD-endopeptidase MepM/ murein hydrolase activator NlpD
VTLHATARARLRVLLIAAVIIGGLAVLLWARGRRVGLEPTPARLNQQPAAGQLPGDSSQRSTSPNQPASSPAAATSAITAASPGEASGEDTPPLQDDQALSKPGTLAGSFVGSLKLIIPVAGVRPDKLLDTFTDARSEGRIHDAIDIPAPAGTPVLAAADGEVIKLFQSERGGTTIYQLSTDRKLVFYYAHLQRYADGLVPGKFVRQGEVIGYVGDTGNAGAGNFHLHFSISVIADPKRYWEGTNINPYPLLRK